MGGGFGGEWIHVYVWLRSFVVHLKLSQNCYSAIQFSSVAWSCPTLCDAMDHITTGLPVIHQFPEFTQTHVQWDSDAIQPSHPLLSPSPPSFNLSRHQGLLKESILPIRWPKYWNFSFNISPSNEYSGLISFRMDWLDLLVVQRSQESSSTP